MKTNSVYKIKNREMSKFFYGFVIVLVMMSCGKDIDLFVPRSNQGDTGDLSRLITRLSDDLSGDITYIIQVPCEGDKVFKVDKDVVIQIPTGFVDLNQYPCTNGYFDLHVTVCDTKGEILVAGIPTISEGKLLESRIELNLQIKDGNSHVRLAHGKQIGIKVSDIDPRDRMELFYGNEDNSEWIEVDDDNAVWDNVFNGDWFFQDSSGIITGFGYECFSDSTDWINVDVFFEVPDHQRTDVCVELPAEFTNTNTAVFMVFDDYKSVLAMRGDAELMKFCEPYGATPLGFRVTFVVVSELGEDNYLFTKKSTVITPNHHEILTPMKTPYDEIQNFINTL